MDNQIDNRFDRTFQYDQAGRLTANDFGNPTDGVPFTQTAGYDAFSHLTGRNTTHWGTTTNVSMPYSGTTGRRTQAAGSSAPVYS
jgi:hypothetical protein